MSKKKIRGYFKSIWKRIKIKKNEILENNLIIIIKFVSNVLRNVKGENNYTNIDKLEDFGPLILTGEEDKYSNTIKYAVENPNILNLALTGSFGSGKSSILKTFEHNHLEYKYLNISLATFNEKTLETEKIEYNILKQLFYSVEHKKIPESRFKRIENHTGIWLKTVFFAFWLFSVFYFLKIEYLDDLKETLHLNFYNKWLDLLYAVYLVLGTGIILNIIMNFIINFKLTKFKIKETDFENNQDKKTINFENEIDEILYFFEKTPIEIVFIQDIDRFKNNSEIFIKLREINNLINNYEPIKKQRKVTFIYAVSDNVFNENERTKFFDFIIPVIPVINYTSSSSKLLDKLELDIKNKKLTKGFIEDVSLFLNDYRTIKSILNEYIIYKKTIGKQLDSYNNLLAMMIYKNIEPTDFEKLNNNQGYVYNLLENSTELINKAIEQYDERILELNKKLDDVKNEKLNDIKDLRMIYIFKFCELINSENNYSAHGFHLNNQKILLANIITDEYFELFKTQTKINYYYSPHNSTSTNINFKQIENAINQISYSERLETIKNSESKNLNKIKTELLDIDNKKQELNSKKLHELLDNNNSTTYLEKHYTKNNKINNIKLINYLLIKGYINEDYNHYISYFHNGSITKEDNNFLISLLPSEKALSYTYKLKEMDSLLKRIKLQNYHNIAILNFSLIDYLIENNENQKFTSIIGLLIKGKEKSIKFIDEYLQHSDENNKSVFFKALLSRWNELLNLIVSKSNFPTIKIETYLKYIFKYLDFSTIEKIDKQKSLSNYISKLENLNCFNPNEINIETFKKFLENSTVKFENISYNEEYKDLFKFIYEKNLYAINKQMIELFTTNFNLNNTNIENLKTANYTTIKNSGKPKLIKYVDDNLEKYLKNVFLKLENNSNESQESICFILNNKNITIHYEVIEKGKFLIDDLSKINEIDTQSILLIEEKIETNWNNILTYYKKSEEFDETIINYLNYEHNYTVLSKVHIDDSNPSIKTSFAKDLIKSNISNESFSKLVYSLPFAYKDGNEFIEVNNSKMRSLIESKRILLSTENYTLINDEYPNLLIILLEKNAGDFMSTIDNYNLSDFVILEIIKSDLFNPSQKLLVIENTTDDVLISNKTLLIMLSNFLLRNKINRISSNLLIELISNSISFQNKVELTNQYFSFIDDKNLKTVIERIGEPYSKLLLGKHAKVDNTFYNQLLIKNLKEKLISTAKPINTDKQIELIPYAISKL